MHDPEIYLYICPTCHGGKSPDEIQCVDCLIDQAVENKEENYNDYS